MEELTRAGEAADGGLQDRQEVDARLPGQACRVQARRKEASDAADNLRRPRWRWPGHPHARRRGGLARVVCQEGHGQLDIYKTDVESGDQSENAAYCLGQGLHRGAGSDCPHECIGQDQPQKGNGACTSAQRHGAKGGK